MKTKIKFIVILLFTFSLAITGYSQNISIRIEDQSGTSQAPYTAEISLAVIGYSFPYRTEIVTGLSLGTNYVTLHMDMPCETSNNIFRLIATQIYDNNYMYSTSQPSTSWFNTFTYHNTTLNFLPTVIF